MPIVWATRREWPKANAELLMVTGADIASANLPSLAAGREAFALRLAADPL